MQFTSLALDPFSFGVGFATGIGVLIGAIFLFFKIMLTIPVEKK